MVPVITAALLILASQQSIGPSLPIGCTAHMHKVSTDVQLSLAQSKFAEAAKALEAWPIGEVAYSVEGMPDRYGVSVDSGAMAWAAAAGDRIKFARTAGKAPLIKLQFVHQETDRFQDPEWIGPQVVAKIPVSYGPMSTPISKYTVAWGVAKAFGYALGMQFHTKRYHLMGVIFAMPDTVDVPQLSPNISERALLETLMETRDTLSKAIREKRPITVAAPRLEVDEVKKDAGTITQGKKVRFEFKLRNSGNARLLLEQETSCHCIVVAPINFIDPGQSVTLAADLDTIDAMGQFERIITIYSNDPMEPIKLLTARVISLPEYRILPDKMTAVNLADEGPTTFSYTVFATGDNQLQVLSVQLGKDHVTSKITPWEGEIVDELLGPKPERRKGFKVDCTFEPEFPAGLDFVRVVVVTDSKRIPYKDKVIETHKGVFAQPKSAFFGAMAVGQRATRTVVVEHASKAFNVLEATSDNSLFTVRVEKQAGSDKKYNVIVEFAPATAGFINGKVTLKTDLAKYPTLTIPVSGTVQ